LIDIILSVSFCLLHFAIHAPVRVVFSVSAGAMKRRHV